MEIGEQDELQHSVHIEVDVEGSSEDQQTERCSSLVDYVSRRIPKNEQFTMSVSVE